MNIDAWLKRATAFCVAVSSVAAIFWAFFNSDPTTNVQRIGWYFLSRSLTDIIGVTILVALLTFVRKDSRPKNPRRQNASFFLVALTFLWFAKERVNFWRATSYTSYYLNYEPRIDALIRDFRFSDALALSRAVQQDMGARASESVLHEKIRDLDARTSRSAQLKAAGSRGDRKAWNPIATPQNYYLILEAVRLNPQEYGAARVLNSYVIGLRDSLIPSDKVTICHDSNASRGLSVNRFDASVWIETKLQFDACQRAIDDRWQISTAECLVAISARLEIGQAIYKDGELSASLRHLCFDKQFVKPLNTP